VALAYAAAQVDAQRTKSKPVVARAVPMPVPAPAPAVVTRKGAATVAIMPASLTRIQTARAGDPLDDPWLRGVAMVASVQDSMTVTQFGDPDYARLVEYMNKPRSAVMMTFSHDPHLGMTDKAFSGGAVVFQPTVTFDGQRTAALR
jgi:hypothetical protein